jgi:hypothetical protein
VRGRSRFPKVGERLLRGGGGGTLAALDEAFVGLLSGAVGVWLVTFHPVRVHEFSRSIGAWVLLLIAKYGS